MFSSLINIKKTDYFFLKKRPTDYNPNYVWIVAVQDLSKTSPDNAVSSLRKFIFSNLIDINKLTVKKEK